MARGSFSRRTTAVANPAADNFGTNLLAIAAEQRDYFTPVVTSGKTPIPRNSPASGVTLPSAPAAGEKNPGDYGLYPNVIELRSPYTLTPVKQFYPVERLKGNPSPDPSIPGMQMGAGELHFYLDPTLAPFWLKHLLQTSVPDAGTTAPNFEGAFTNSELEIADGHDFTSTATLTLLPAKQPHALIDVVRKKTTTGNGLKPPAGMTSAKLEIKANGLGASTSRTFTISGIDHNGATLTEQLTVTGTTPVATRWYYTSDVVIKAPSTATGLDDVDIKLYLTELYEHKLKFVSTVSEGLTLEVREGAKDTPILYGGLLVSRGIFRLEQVARMQMMVIANEAHPRCPMHNDDLEASELTNFGRLDFNAVPMPGMTWEVGGDNVPSDMQGLYRVAQMGLAIDNRLAPPAASNAETFFYPKPVRKMNRELQMQVAIDLSREANFDQFVGGLPFRQTFSAASKKYGDAYQAIRITGPYSQIVNNPTRQVNGVGEILQQIVTRMHVGPAAEGNDEVEISVINKRPMI